MSEDIKLNSHGTNAKIKFHILRDKNMRKIGFSDLDGKNWYYCRNVFRSRDNEDWISFSVTIPKDGSDGWVDVLDEAFCQPYDWQMMLARYEDNPPIAAVIVNHRVIAEMLQLQALGVISGYREGDYI